MKKILYILIDASIILGCSGAGNTISESNAINKCLADKDYKYEELLTKTDIAKYVNIDEPSYKMDISSTKGKYGSCVYS